MPAAELVADPQYLGIERRDPVIVEISSGQNKALCGDAVTCIMWSDDGATNVEIVDYH